MTDYTQALAAAREAHTYVKHLGMTRAEAALGDLLAALDAARGQAVAWQVTVVDNTGTHDYAKWAGLQAPPAAAVPAGYALVPVEPTQAMLDAAGMCIIPDGKEWLDQSNREVWATMLAAARKGE